MPGEQVAPVGGVGAEGAAVALVGGAAGLGSDLLRGDRPHALIALILRLVLFDGLGLGAVGLQPRLEPLQETCDLL